MGLQIIFAAMFVKLNLRHALSDLLSSLNTHNPPKPLRQRLFTIGMHVSKHRVHSAQEAAYRPSDLHLIFTSRELVYIPALPPTKQYKKLKENDVIQELQPGSTDSYCSKIIDDYHFRPHALDSICLLSFAQKYKKYKPPHGSSSALKMLNSEYCIKPPKKNAVVRYIASAFNSDDYFYSLSYFCIGPIDPMKI